MTSLDELQRRVLEDARGHIEPSDRDAARVYARLEAVLGRSVAVTSGCAETRVTGTSPRWIPFLAPFRRRRNTALTFAFVAALAGVATGYQRGWFASRAASPTPPSSSTHAVALSSARNARATFDRAEPTVDEPAVDEPAVDASAVDASAVDELAVDEPAVDEPATVSSASSEPKQRPLPARSASRATSEESRATAPITAEDFAEEVRLLRDVESAIRASKGALALTRLSELNRRFPRGRLLAEREAATVMARCLQAEPARARQLAEAYLRRAASRVYHERVRRLCQLDAASEEKATERSTLEKGTAATGD
jgi:hypothetical protein